MGFKNAYQLCVQIFPLAMFRVEGGFPGGQSHGSGDGQGIAQGIGRLPRVFFCDGDQQLPVVRFCGTIGHAVDQHCVEDEHYGSRSGQRYSEAECEAAGYAWLVLLLVGMSTFIPPLFYFNTYIPKKSINKKRKYINDLLLSFAAY